jgi:hypothetical protein
LRLARGSEDGARIAFQNLEPRGDIGGVIRMRMVRDAEIGQDEAAENLDRDLFECIGGRDEPAAQIAIETMRRP